MAPHLSFLQHAVQAICKSGLADRKVPVAAYAITFYGSVVVIKVRGNTLIVARGKLFTRQYLQYAYIRVFAENNTG